MNEAWSCIQPARVIPLSHTWTVRDFSYFMSKSEDMSIYSSVFPATNTKGRFPKWLFELTQCRKTDSYDDPYYISLHLHLISSDELPVFAKLNFCVLNAELEKTAIAHSGSFRFNKGRYLEDIYSFSNFVKKDFLLDENNGLLSNDTLTIEFEINVCAKETAHISSQSKDVEQSVCDWKPLFDSVCNWKPLFDVKQICDVTLSAGDQEFLAHKAILALRSPVFATMLFEHKMMEMNQNKVTIADIDPKVLEEMLVFIYTDKSPNLKNMAVELFVAAEKYNLLRLKGMCEEFLCTNITARNAVEILSLADRHDAEMLRDCAITYISSQATRLMKTQAWKDLLLKNQTLVSKAFEETLK